MMIAFKCGYQNIYFRTYGKTESIEQRYQFVTPLALLTMQINIANNTNNNKHKYCLIDNTNYNNAKNKKRMKMFIAFIEYIIKNVHQFGGKKRVYNHIVDTNASQIILNLGTKSKIRKYFIQMGEREHEN